MTVQSVTSYAFVVGGVIMRVCSAALSAITLLLTGCGSQDASGFYVIRSDNEVTLVQLVEDKDHKLTGRIEINTIAPDATVTTKAASLDGSVSGNVLMLRPASVWLGGIQASGTYSSNSLHLTGEGFNITAERSSLDEYQEALSKLKSDASERQEKLAQTNAALRKEEARMQGERNIAAAVASLRESTLRITNAATRLDNGISRSPNFGNLAATNTARVSRMLTAASKMPEAQRSQLGVDANQVIVDTNQIGISRNQYSMSLNDVVDDAERAAAPLAKHCGGTPAPSIAVACKEGFAALNAFEKAAERAKISFSPHKQRIADEMTRQEELAAKID